MSVSSAGGGRATESMFKHFRAGETVSVGYQLVLNDAERPVGLLGPNGFVRGGVEPDGPLTPIVRESLGANAEVRSSGCCATPTALT